MLTRARPFIELDCTDESNPNLLGYQLDLAKIDQALTHGLMVSMLFISLKLISL